MNANIKSLSNATSKKKSMQDLLNTSVNSINSILSSSKSKGSMKKLRSDSAKKKLSNGSNNSSQSNQNSNMNLCNKDDLNINKISKNNSVMNIGDDKINDKEIYQNN